MIVGALVISFHSAARRNIPEYEATVGFAFKARLRRCFTRYTRVIFLPFGTAAYTVDIVKRFPKLSTVVISVCLSFFQAGIATAQSHTEKSARKVIARVTPVYPQLARTSNIAGTVKLEALVLADGTVKSVQVKGGHPVLALAAEDALRSWRWEKTEQDSIELLEFRFNP